MKIQSPAVLTAHKNETLQTRVRFQPQRTQTDKVRFINLNKIQSPAVPPDCTQKMKLFKLVFDLSNSV